MLRREDGGKGELVREGIEEMEERGRDRGREGIVEGGRYGGTGGGTREIGRKGDRRRKEGIESRKEEEEMREGGDKMEGWRQEGK